MESEVRKIITSILIELATLTVGIVLGAIFIKLMYIVGYYSCQKP